MSDDKPVTAANWPTCDFCLDRLDDLFDGPTVKDVWTAIRLDFPDLPTWVQLTDGTHGGLVLCANMDLALYLQQLVIQDKGWPDGEGPGEGEPVEPPTPKYLMVPEPPKPITIEALRSMTEKTQTSLAEAEVQRILEREAWPAACAGRSSATFRTRSGNVLAALKDQGFTIEGAADEDDDADAARGYGPLYRLSWEG